MIKMLDGNTLPITCTADDLIEDIKEKISEVT